MTEKKKRKPSSLFVLIPLLALATVREPARGKMSQFKLELPVSIEGFIRVPGPRTIRHDTIFEYMDGAGELYLGYRFDRLEVTEYKSPNGEEILVELYFMETPDDAFGLLSLDWEGDPVRFPSAPKPGAEEPRAWPRALYGEGLMRLRSGALYARVLAGRETPESREAIFGLGRIIVGNHDLPPEPDLLDRTPSELGPDWRQRKDRTSYFRSHLVLNSLYYLSQDNIFDLNLDTEAVLTTYIEDAPLGSGSLRALLINYPDADSARKAVGHFRRVYLPDRPAESKEKSDFHSVEDGWLGYATAGRLAAFVFECPDRETAEAFIDRLSKNPE